MNRVFARPLLVPAAILCSVTLAGCGAEVQGVTGKVTVNGKPLTSGGVTFVPDKDKGNTATTNAFGSIKEDGTYELTTEGKAGAAPGWYKVLIVANEPAKAKEPYAKPRSLVNGRYATAATSDLAVEVKPGASYDLTPAGPEESQ